MRRLTGNLALSIASICTFLLVAELGVRLLARTPPALLVGDPVVGKRFRPGFSGRVLVPECGCDVDLRFNNEGLRGPDRPYAKPAGVKRIALVGDSMVAAVATAEERTLAARLEGQLARSRPESRFEVMNAGVASSSTGGELALYRAVLSRYAPDVVLLVFWVGNDLADNSQELTRAPRLYFDLDASGRLMERPFAFRPSPIGEWLDRWSRLYAWQKTAVRQARAGWNAAQGSVEPTELVFAQPEPPAVARAWAITSALLEAFRAETAAQGTKLVLVLAPSAPQIYDDLWQELADRAQRQGTPVSRDHPDERLRALSQAAGIPFLSLLPSFREAAPGRDSRRSTEQLFYEGRFHWNDRGNAVAASAIHSFLLETVPAGH